MKAENITRLIGQRVELEKRISAPYFEIGIAARAELTALEAENAAKDEALEYVRTHGTMLSTPGGACAGCRKAVDSALSPPTGKVLVDLEKLREMRDLARTGLAPSAFELGKLSWANHRLNAIARDLTALLDTHVASGEGEG